MTIPKTVPLSLGATICLLVSACGGLRPLNDPNQPPNEALSRIARLKTFHIAFETTKACQLERAGGEESPEGEWAPVEANTLTKSTFTVLDARAESHDEEVRSVSLRVQNGKDAPYWLRNVPAESTVETSRRWRCAIDESWIATKAPRLKAKVVRLALDSTRCPGIVPVMGSRADVSFSPYTVVGYGLFAGTAPTDEQAAKGEPGVVALGVKLESEGGEKRLTVPSAVFDRCFAPADRMPPKPREAAELIEWLTSSSPDATTPPAVTAETVKGVTGIDLADCEHGRIGSLSHIECRRPVLRIISDASPGPFGPSVIQLVQDRVVDSMHLLDGKLVGAGQAVSVTTVVRTPGLAPDSAFAKAFTAALQESIADEKHRFDRGTRGFQLVTAADAAAGAAAPATHHVDLEVSYAVPEVETTVEKRTHRYVAGKKTVANPDYDKAVQEVAAAKANVTNAQQEAQLLQSTAGAATQACDAIGGFGAMLCDFTASTAGGALATDRVDSARTRLAQAEAAFSTTPKEVQVDDVKEFEYEAKIMRRRGQATAKLSIVAAGRPSPTSSGPRGAPQPTPAASTTAGPGVPLGLSRKGPAAPATGKAREPAPPALPPLPPTGAPKGAGGALFSTAIQVPFDASDVEIPDDPARQLKGKQATPPTAEDVERELARALVTRVDEAVIRWGEQRLIGGDIGDLKPGTRPWMVAVGRHSTPDRPLKLVSDILETRPEVIKSGQVTYPVKMPAEARDRCFVFAAIPMDDTTDIDLELGLAPGGKLDRLLPCARDVRPAKESAFEICSPQPGEYAVRVSIGKGVGSKQGVLVSMFESTPGQATKEDTLAATKGLPTTARRGETMQLNGEGVVTYKGINEQVVVGKQGDRDGDGIADDDDRCPYEPETNNAYLDDDGCPDEAPAKR